MIKLTLIIIFLVIGGIAALRRQQRNRQLETAASDVSKQLDAGNMDVASLGAELDMLIRRKKATTAAGMTPLIIAEIAKELPDKFNILQTKTGNDDDGVIIANATVIDIDLTRNGSREVEVIYPCWLYIKANAAENYIDFRSMIPQNKDHQYVLEDLADHAMAMAIRAGNTVT